MSGHYKIGHSNNPIGRLVQLDTGPSPARLLHEILSAAAPDVETALHAAFADKRVRGEWFRLSPEDVAMICAIGQCDRPEELPAQLRELRPIPAAIGKSVGRGILVRLTLRQYEKVRLAAESEGMSLVRWMVREGEREAARRCPTL
jgi:hypothetical protein